MPEEKFGVEIELSRVWRRVSLFQFGLGKQLHKRYMHTLRNIAAWSGMLGSSLFVAVFWLEGWLREDYDPFSMYISELSIGPRGWIQVTNFIVLGALLLVFAIGVAIEFRTGKASKLGLALLAIIGFCVFLSGPFVLDPADVISKQDSWYGAVHFFVGTTAFFLMPISCYVYYRRFQDEPKWQALAGWTLATCIAVIAALLLQELGEHRLLAEYNIFIAYTGLLQRIVVTVYFSWIFAFALALQRNATGRAS